MLFPKFLICLDCGFARVAVPETELIRCCILHGSPDCDFD